MTKFILIILIICSTAYSKNHNLRNKKGAGSIVVSSEWNLLKEAFGMPFLFISKGEAPKSSLSVTFTGLKNIKLSDKGLKKAQDDYIKGRKKWASRYSAEVIKYFPYKVFKNSKGQRVHQIGFNYKRVNGEFLEYSYYIECPKSFTHLKALLAVKRADLIKEVEKSIDSFKCVSK